MAGPVPLEERGGDQGRQRAAAGAPEIRDAAERSPTHLGELSVAVALAVMLL